MNAPKRAKIETILAIPRLLLPAVFAVLLTFAILLQWLGQAYHCEFGAYPDESAHFITGLMIRDYIAAGCPATPLKYAEEYYVHYPKVAFGMWGPLLHITEGVWMLVFPPSRVSVLVLMAAIASLTATLLFWVLAKEFGGLLGLVAGFVFLMAPTVQAFTGMVMADGLVALWDLGAVLAFGRYLNSREWKYSLWFGAFACLSILTKGNGGALLLLPLFAILLTRRFALLKERAFWAGVALIIAVGGPWQYYSARMLSGILDRRPGWTFFPEYTAWLFTMAGAAFLPVLLLGFYSRIVAPSRKGGIDGKWASAAALILSVWAFHCLIPAAAPEPRYMIAVIPPILMFSIAGMETAAGWVRISAPLRYRSWAVAAVLLALFLATTFSIRRKSYHGFDQVAERLGQPEYKHSAILVSSEADGEGMLIAEIAMREDRPAHFVLRASKMLSQSDWNAMRYHLLYNTPGEVMKFLGSVPVELVVIDNQAGELPLLHHKLLKQTIAAFPGQWEHIGSFPVPPAVKPRPGIDVYRLKPAAGKSVGRIRINLPYTLGRAIER
ncbi:MAG: glycosyltransferase family 39 protein [Acidobacteria bacterium]|nr:glycosyltransferase family 39 protein [Acidobacteriota bacterium]